MERPYDIEIEPEVRAWLDALPHEHYRAVERHADRLAHEPTTLGEPYSRHSGVTVSRGYHTSWAIPEEHRADPAYVEAGAAIALGQAVYDRRMSLGIDQASLAERTGLSTEDIDRLEGGGTVPTLPLLRTLAKALDAALDVSIDTEETRVSFVPHAA
ncbi:XRE family transcriptional regulator [Streptomyces malaysiensis]|uniref:XRE family transcriptional regulator n=1 Tax=Streptomyces malaysiensis TaxID=92644 RepID=UPI00202E7C1D|nr:XRE family transcriptional regulator [Streptomyces samsunensis]MCQ6251204.1 helix-turn-helix domain-containing protein [Streptomyces malaysiensis]